MFRCIVYCYTTIVGWRIFAQILCHEGALKRPEAAILGQYWKIFNISEYLQLLFSEYCSKILEDLMGMACIAVSLNKIFNETFQLFL